MEKSKQFNKLKIFISYAAEQLDIAEKIYLTLSNSGHDVFFDRTSLTPGKDYNPAILAEIRNSDVFVFLISPQSVEDGTYAKTELRFAQSVWKAPQGHILPVMAVEMALEEIPEYLKAVTILTPKGNLVAEVAATISDIATGWSPEQTVYGQGEVLKKTGQRLKQIELDQERAAIEREWHKEKKDFRILLDNKNEPAPLYNFMLIAGLLVIAIATWEKERFYSILFILGAIGYLIFFIIKTKMYEAAEERRRAMELEVLERNSDSNSRASESTADEKTKESE